MVFIAKDELIPFFFLLNIYPLKAMPSNRNTLIIRADANAQIGIGHVMRCLALGQAWKDAGGNVVFFTRCDSTAILQRLHNENFVVRELNDESEIQSEIIDLKSSESSPWLVLDGYHFDLSCQQGIRAAGIKLLLIDDYNHLPQYEADILVNQNIGAENIEYNCNPNCRQLLGNRYVMLRREFRGAREKKRTIPSAGRRLLVTLGGADPLNATLKVIEALRQSSIPDLHAKVIVGPANPHLESLQKAVPSLTINCELLNSVRDMRTLMDWADFAISAAGSTCWELCIEGVPLMTLIVADNQKGVAMGMQAHHVAETLGEAGCVAPNDIANLLDFYMKDPVERQRMSLAGMKLIDGFGVERVLSHPASVCGVNLYRKILSFRYATIDDALLLFDWANDETNRQNSFSKEPIAWDDHVHWLQEKLDSDDTVLFLAELDGQAVGQIRYDKQSNTDAVIDISVSSDFRGMGLAALMVSNTLDCAARNLGVQRHIAIVHSSNTASSHAFLKAGFSFREKRRIKGIDCRVVYKVMV